MRIALLLLSLGVVQAQMPGPATLPPAETVCLPSYANCGGETYCGAKDCTGCCRVPEQSCFKRDDTYWQCRETCPDDWVCTAVSAPPTFSGAPSFAPTGTPTGVPSYSPQIKMCSNEMVQISGQAGRIISGPNVYDPNMRCGWRIDTGRGVELTFVRFNTEWAYDFVRIYDGSAKPEALLDYYLNGAGGEGVNPGDAQYHDTQYLLSGDVMPSPISTTGSMVVIFTSDQSISGTGFEATFAPASPTAQRLYLEPSVKCSGQVSVTGSSGAISSTTDGSNYANGADCSWLIRPADGSQLIFLQFSEFNTEQYQDLVRVYEGSTSSSTLLAQFSGDRSGQQTEVMSSTGEMLVQFSTDGTNTRSGFRASFQGINPAGGASDSDRKTPGGASTLCSGSMTMRTQTGVFSSGVQSTLDFAAQERKHYANDMLCTWEIMPFGLDGVVVLSLDDLQTENYYDTIDVYDNVGDAKALLAQVSGTYVGQLTPGPFVATSGKMTVIFKSDFSTTGIGFTASYMGRGETAAPQETVSPAKSASVGLTNPPSFDVCAGQVSLKAADGILTDGSAEYTNMASCTWLIEPTRAGLTPSLIELSFNSFSLENTYDWLYVYDGKDETAPRIGQFTGGAQPAKQVALSGTMFVQMITDGGVVESGFSASYTSTFGSASAYYSGGSVADSATDGKSGNGILVAALCGVGLVGLVGALFGAVALRKHNQRKQNVKEWSNRQTEGEGGGMSAECGAEMAVPDAVGSDAPTTDVNMFVYSPDASPETVVERQAEMRRVESQMKPKSAW